MYRNPLIYLMEICIAGRICDGLKHLMDHRDEALRLVFVARDLFLERNQLTFKLLLDAVKQLNFELDEQGR